ncbi:hypothetical protein BS47DRAFT_1389777 [Hydnum rufescens UP504]|uniref:PIG-P domain-containing protein n=1 Tax=Hydnum rufescens UP504 TaxID=1448309 RepID=A0A9P6DXJ8_9AGAM|nr:hypothetical protein BS47DRAFT_1389777 [Hydnum rufescens UP504]
MSNEWDSPAADAKATGGGRAREFYGFVAVVLTSLAWIIFLIWSIVPDHWLLAAGIEWYPSRFASGMGHTSTLVLYHLGSAYVLDVFALAASNTPAFEELRALTDEYAIIPSTQDGAPNPYLAHSSQNVVPEIYDLPIGIFAYAYACGLPDAACQADRSARAD